MENYQSTEDWQIARENNSNRVVDVFMAALPRQLHVVTTVESVLKNKETRSVTITANKYSDAEFQELQLRLAGLNSLYKVEIYLYRGDNAKGSNEKLKYIHKGSGKYIALVDDDLILSPNHFEYLIQGCEKYDAYVSLHGAVLAQRPLRSYYRDRMVLRGLGNVLFDSEVDIASNCGSLFKRSHFPQDMLKEMYERSPDESMDDIWMAFLCKRMGVKRYVLSHQEGYMKHKVQHKEDEYVFDKHALVVGADKPMTDFINNFWDKK